MKYTANMGLRKPEGGEYYSIEDFNANADMLDGAVTAKANKPASFTLGNLTSIGTGGNLEDSGKNPYDFAGADHNHDATYAPISHVRDAAVHVGADEKAAIAAVASKADRTYIDSTLSTKLDKKDLYKPAIVTPTDIALPMNSGWSGTLVFRQVGATVNVIGSGVSYNAAITTALPIRLASMPVGYRPKDDIHRKTFQCSTWQTSDAIASGYVRGGGEIQIYPYTTVTIPAHTQMTINFSYFAKA